MSTSMECAETEHNRSEQLLAQSERDARDEHPVCFSRLRPVRRQGVSLPWLSHDETLSCQEGRASDEDAKPVGGFSSETVSQRLVPVDRCRLCLPPGLHTI